MVYLNCAKDALWLVEVTANYDLSNRDRDLIAEIASEEARKSRGAYSFIVHGIVESNTSSTLLVEACQTALNNLLLVLSDNLAYDISWTRYDKEKWQVFHAADGSPRRAKVLIDLEQIDEELQYYIEF